MNLTNETAVNVATLLQEPVGAQRSFELHLDRLELDADLTATYVDATMRLTRLSDAILANVVADARVELICQRCLENFETSTRAKFQEEFRVAYDVRSGNAVFGTADDERFEISDAHELDIREPLRQELIVALPMRPDCGPTCSGPAMIDDGSADEVDERFAALAALLSGTNEDRVDAGDSANR
jgi:uncharacterized protein